MWFFKSKDKKKETKPAKKAEPAKKPETKTTTAKKPTTKSAVKNERKTTTKATTTKSATKSESKAKKDLGAYRVVYDKEDRLWKIKRDGAKRVIDSYATKDEALKRVDELCESNNAKVYVHKKDGKFQKQ